MSDAAPGPREPASLIAAIERVAFTDSARIAVTFGEKMRTYGDLVERSRRCAHGLTDVLEVRSGERVAILTRNRIEYFEVEMAVSELSAVMVPVSWRYVVPEVVAVLAASEACVLVAEPDLAAGLKVEREAGRLPHIRKVVTFGAPGVVGDIEYEALLGDGVLTRRFSALVGRATDPHEIIYTSGTTGMPKGAVWTMRGVVANAVQQIADFGLGRDCATYVAFDLNYIGGRHQLAWALLLQGGQVHVKSSSGFDAPEVVNAVQRLEVTHLLLVPTMFTDVLEYLELHGSRWPHMRMVMCGGLP